MKTFAQSSSLQSFIARGKRYVVGRGPGCYAYVCRVLNEWGTGRELELLSAAAYEDGNYEDDCLAVIWSYEDENGKIAAAVETQADW